MKKILILLLISVSFSAIAQRKLFGLDLNATPSLDFRIAMGKVGSPSANMTMQQFLDFTTSNLDVYSTTEIDNFFSNYISKTNLTVFIPTLDYHPSTKKYVDDKTSGTQNTSSAITVVGGVKTQVFSFVSTIDEDQVVPFPESFGTKCVGVQVTPHILGDNTPVVSSTSVTINRDDSVAGSVTIYITATGY